MRHVLFSLLCGLFLSHLAIVDQSRAGTILGPVYDPYSESNLYVVSPPGTWRQAEEAAVQLGGHLVTIHSAEENAFLVDKVLRDFTGQGGPNLTRAPIWIGLYDPTGIAADDMPSGPNSPHAANFKWVDGSSSTYRNWEPSSSEPNDCWNHEYYGEINPIVFYPLGTWTDADLNDRDPQGPGGKLVSYGPIYGLVSVPIDVSQAPAAIYDPVADYNAGWKAEKNPNGVWTYGWSSTLNSPLNLYKQKDNHKEYNPNANFDDWNDANELSGKTPCIWKNVGEKYSDSNIDIPAGALILHGGGPSGNDYSHVVWTAPHDGSFSLDATFILRQLTPNSQTNVDILVNGKNLFERTLNNYGEKCSHNVVLSLIAGDKIDFAVGIPGTVLHGESTQLEAIITDVTKPSARQGHEKTILVDSAVEAWQDSGVDVVAGQTLKVTASGKVFSQIDIGTGPPSYFNPDGSGNHNDGTQLVNDTVLPSAVAYTLIGKVGGTTAFGTGAPVPEGVLGKGAGFVGSSYSQKIPTSGRLFFAFNDELHFFGDNSGTFKVAFQVAQEPSARPSTEKHVRELAKYLDGVKIAEPIAYRQLSVYPILVDDVPLLRGRWLTLDKAISRGILEVTEKSGGSVPVVRVGNKSKDENVLIMTGEVIAGGMQTRTVRHDVVLAPGQTIDLDVFCVEAHRWAGEGKFSGGSKTMLPQSIQGELRKGAEQSKIWSEVARNNSSLKAENSTGSLEMALNAPPVRRKLEDVRRKIVPQIPSGTVGFIFVDHGRALGAEFFGSENLARELLPKLLDSYVVDYVILRGSDTDRAGKSDNRVAIDFFEQVCRTGSQRATTPGSGSGISTRQGDLLGDGVSMDDTPVHYGVQFGERNEPKPNPRSRPSIIYPNSRQQSEINQR